MRSLYSVLAKRFLTKPAPECAKAVMSVGFSSASIAHPVFSDLMKKAPQTLILRAQDERQPNRSAREQAIALSFIFRVGKMIQPPFWRKPWKNADFALMISQVRKKLPRGA